MTMKERKKITLSREEIMKILKRKDIKDDLEITYDVEIDFTNFKAKWKKRDKK